MRWKLLIAASLLAAAVGAGVCYAAAYFLLPPGAGAPAWAAALLLAPLGAVTYAAVFVYRHTARRRGLQAAAAALLASALTLAALALGASLRARPGPELAPAAPAKAA